MCGSDAPEQKPGPYELKMVELANRKMDDYESVYQPLQQDMITESQKYDQPWYAQQQANIIASGSRSPEVPVSANVGAGLKQALVNSQMTARFGTAFGAGTGDLLAKQQGSAYKLGLAQAGRRQSKTTSGIYGALSANEVGQNSAINNAKQSINNANYGALGSAMGTATGYWLAKHKEGDATLPVSPFARATKNHETWTHNSHTPRFGMYS